MKFSTSDRERFWAKVKQAKTGCWEWSGGCTSHGYGAFGINHRVLPAHRIAFAIAYSGITIAGKVICHRCDNPPCVRPDHLFVGTNLDNKLDSVLKDRAFTKYSAQLVRDVLNECVDGSTDPVLFALSRNANLGWVRGVMYGRIHRRILPSITRINPPSRLDEFSLRKVSPQRRNQLRHQKQGLCQFCTKPLETTLHCSEHAEKHRERLRNLMRKKFGYKPRKLLQQ